MHHPQGAEPDRSARRALAVVLSLAAHAAVLCAMVLARPPRPAAPIPEAEHATLVQVVNLAPDPAPAPAAVTPAPPQPAPPRPSQAKTARRPPDEPTLSADPQPFISEAQLAGAATAESGGGDGSGAGAGGGPCNMARRLQAELRRDRLVAAAVSGSSRPIVVWNGDWLRSAGEEGKGLAAVREAIMWSVAFAPAACRAQPVHGLVLLSLDGGARLVVGGGDWRWQDLLALHRGG